MDIRRTAAATGDCLCVFLLFVTVFKRLCLQTTSADELGGFDTQTAQQQQQHGAPQLQEVSPDQPALSPEELLLAVSRIKQERADTPPAEEARGAAGTGGEETR